MVTLNDEVETEGIVTRDELLAMGCEEIMSPRGRKGYVVEGVVFAVMCTKCSTVKHENKFTRNKRGFCNVSVHCKECRRKYREETRDRISAYNREYQEENPCYWKEYYERNPGYWKEKSREYREMYPDYQKEKTREFSRKNPGYFAEKSREFHRRNPGYFAEKSRRFIEKNPDYYYKRRKENKGMYRLYRQRRRARVTALPYDITDEQLTEINSYFYNTCALSEGTTDLHDDHVIPLSVGHGGTTYGNLILLSAELNLSKQAQHIFEWFSANRVRFGLSQRKFDELIAYLADANEMTTQEYRKYVDWCFDNPRVICETTGELVFKDGAINERTTKGRR